MDVRRLLRVLVAGGVGGAVSETHVMPIGSILREAGARVKNKSYRRSAVGRDVGRFMRALRWEDKSESTRNSYETTLARLANEHDDFEGGLAGFCTPVGTEYLREFLDRNWSDSAPATRANRLAALHSCFQWALLEGIVSFDPSAPIKSPGKRRRSDRKAYPQEAIHRLVSAQETLRDQCAVQLVARLGLRKNELRVLRVGEIDLVRDLLTVHGKGGHVDLMPIGLPSLATDLANHINWDERKPDEYLLYPKNRKRDPMESSSLHDWFKRCLAKAGLPSTVKLHEMRHTAADNLYRHTGDIVRAAQLLRHADVSTTQRYLHPTRADLAASLADLDGDWSK